MTSTLDGIGKATRWAPSKERLSPVNADQTALTKARYNRQAGSYDQRMAMMERMGFRNLREHLWSLVSGPEVLEVGVGTGANFPFYREGIKVTGIDLSDRMLEQAYRRAERDAVAVKLLEMDAQDLRFPSCSFDSVVATFVFCSVPDPVRGLQEVKRVLKPGGRLVLLEHVRAPGILGPLFDLMNPLVVRIEGANINRRTVENVKRAGFTIESVEDHALGIVNLIVAGNGNG